MKMPKVKKCEVPECAYNRNNMCHALAITIGDKVKPECDTMCVCSSKGGVSDVIAGVGACKVSSCAHNRNLECRASNICVGHKGNEVDCLTFESR